MVQSSRLSASQRNQCRIEQNKFKQYLFYIIENYGKCQSYIYNEVTKVHIYNKYIR